MSRAITVRKFVFLLIFGVISFLAVSSVSAEMAFITGDVYTRHPVTNAKVYLPGVKIYRQDGDGALIAPEGADPIGGCDDWVFNKGYWWPWAAKWDQWYCSNPANGCPITEQWCAQKNAQYHRWNTFDDGYCDYTDPNTDHPGPEPQISIAATDIANHCRADHGNVFTTSGAGGSYYMGNGDYIRNDPNIWDQTPPPDVIIRQNEPPPTTLGYIYGYQRLCPSTNGRGQGPYNPSDPAVDMKYVEYRNGNPPPLNFCGFSCLENPHHIKAFFPSGWWAQHGWRVPWVTNFDTSDPKGGGSWMTKFTDDPVGFWGYTVRSIADSHATKDWPDSIYGNYKREEFYEIYIGNNMGFDGFDYEWIPPGTWNTPPNVTSVSPSTDTPWIGTHADTDNGEACVDNNPYVYEANFQDVDGSYDIDLIEFSLAKDSQLNDGAQRDWPLRIMFAQKWAEDAGREFANFDFFVRDAEVDGGSTDRCFNASGTAVSRDPSGYNQVGGDPWSVGSNPSTLTAKTDPTYKLWCYGVDDHSWNPAQANDPTAALKTSFSGRNWDVYYITNDINVYGDGYEATLVGVNNPNAGSWDEASYVAYERGGGRNVQAHFVVIFDGGNSVASNTASPWTGEYHNLWRIRDLQENEDEIADSAHNNEVVLPFSVGYHHKFGKTKIDLKAPEIRLNTPNPIGGNDVQIPWYASDTGGSQLSRAWGDLSTSIGSAPFIWNVTGLSTNRRPASGWENVTHTFATMPAGPVDFAGFCQDGSCNKSPNTNNTTTLTLYDPWLMTRGGLVYSKDAVNALAKDLDGTLNLCPDGTQTCLPFHPESRFSDPPNGEIPWNFERQEVALSSEWLSTNASFVNDHLRNWDTATTFQSEGYDDLNNKLWYQILLDKADKNLQLYPDRYNIVEGYGSVAPSSISNICADSSKTCVVKTQNALNVNSELVCDRQTFIFVNGPLTINNKISTNGNANGCIFVARNTVIIEPVRGGSNSNSYAEFDELEAFIVTDGELRIHPTSDAANPYGIKVWGGLLSFGESAGQSLHFDRTLKNQFNQDKPAYVLHHDARYYDIARKVVDDDKDAYKEEVGQDAN